MYAPGQVVHDDTGQHVALCHCVYGLRPAVLATPVLLWAAGHQVTPPDLYSGRLAEVDRRAIRALPVCRHDWHRVLALSAWYFGSMSGSVRCSTSYGRNTRTAGPLRSRAVRSGRRGPLMPIGGLQVSPEFLTAVIRHYVEQPEQRNGIGTEAELDRLRTTLPAQSFAEADRKS